MSESYLTGKGFIGSRLAQKVEATAIPHDKILQTQLEDYRNFYFLSTYGNMAHHKDEDMMYKANVTDLVDVLIKSRDIDFDSFVFMSSSSVKLRTQTTYSRLKRAAEEILLAFMERHDRPVCIIRPMSVTGVGEQSEHLIPTLIRSCYTGQEVPFVPHPVHDFIDVEDVVHGIMVLSSLGARGIFELGMGESYSNQQVLEMVEEATGEKANIKIVESLRPYDNKDWVSRNLKARNHGWYPRKSLEMSIYEMVKDYEKNKL